MINVPQSTLEKPLTAIDFIAALDDCDTVTEIQQFSAAVPLEVRQDDRFNRAVAIKLAAINRRGKR